MSQSKILFKKDVCERNAKERRVGVLLVHYQSRRDCRRYTVIICHHLEMYLRVTALLISMQCFVTQWNPKGVFRYLSTKMCYWGATYSVFTFLNATYRIKRSVFGSWIYTASHNFKAVVIRDTVWQGLRNIFMKNLVSHYLPSKVTNLSNL